MMKWIAISPAELSLLNTLVQSDVESIVDIVNHLPPHGNDTWQPHEVADMKVELQVAQSVLTKLKTA
jgi:hypothetical protein